MSIRIALAGNPNCGKTTVFNALTGSNQFVGNWPGVTVEKKEGKLRKHDGVIITDLPGIYSLSPYTLEEVVAREYLVNERPDAILNIIDGTNLERNLYLTTQLAELGIPMLIAVNMMDVVRKRGDKIDTAALSKSLGCKIVEISALKNEGVMEAAEEAIKVANAAKPVPKHAFSGPVEHTIAHIEEAVVHEMPEEQQRWYAVKLFERDMKAVEKLNIPKATMDHVENDIAAVEKELDDDAESIITNERYEYIAKIIKNSYRKKSEGQLTTSDKIDRVVTNRWLGLPIFALIMVIVYYISVTTVGTWATDWANDGLFGDGFHLFNIKGDYDKDVDAWAEKYVFTDKVKDVVKQAAADPDIKGAPEVLAAIEDGDFGAFEEAYGSYRDEFYKHEAEKEEDAEEAAEDEKASDAKADDAKAPESAAADAKASEGAEATADAKAPEGAEAADADKAKEQVALVRVGEDGGKIYDVDAALGEALEEGEFAAPDPSKYGIWIPGVPVVVERLLDAINCNDVIKSLVLDGIVAGVGAVLGFVPQMLVLFFFLAFLESCGYMARVAFIMDRIFRRFGLSGKSFIPILIGTGCGVPGIMASRTIENQRDRRMTIMTTTFIPCGAKLPIISMITIALFGGAWWVAPSAYFLGMAAIIISGIILKKTKAFAGEAAPFVMELPAYHMPTIGNILRSMWERGWSFIKKAGTIILLSSILIWALKSMGWVEGAFTFDPEMDMADSLLGHIGNGIKWIFMPLGFGDATASVATVMGLVAKEEVVGVFGVLDFEGLTRLAGYSFLAFNLLCAPCFAAIGAIRREMNNPKWTWAAIGWQCGFAYVTSLIIYQFGRLFTNQVNIVGFIVAAIALAVMIYFLVKKPYTPEKKGA